jgi:DNA-directed RNA polymerase subunit RPC12/RpoP
MPTFLSLLPLLLIFVVIYFLYKTFKGGIEKYQDTPTFIEYKRLNATLIDDGKVACIYCGGNHIFLKQVGKTPKSILNLHVCKTCGSTLYRSEM